MDGKPGADSEPSDSLDAGVPASLAPRVRPLNHPTQVVLTATRLVTRLCPFFLMVRTRSGNAWQEFSIFLYLPVLVTVEGTGGLEVVTRSQLPRESL